MDDPCYVYESEMNNEMQTSKNTCSASLKVSLSQELSISYLLLMRIVSTDDARQASIKGGSGLSPIQSKCVPRENFIGTVPPLEETLEIVSP